MPLQELILRARLALSVPRLAAQSKRVRAFHESVRTAFPALSVREAGRLHLRYRVSMRKFTLVKQHLDTLSPAALASFVQRHVEIDGQRHLDAVKASDAPVVFVTPHYGSFALGGLKLIQEIGHRKTVNVFYNPPSRNPSSEGFEELFQRFGFGFNALFNDDTAVLKALRVLKRGEALTMMPDVFDVSGHVLYVPFFGRLVPAMAGTALFALKSRATVIPVYSCPGRGLRSTFKIGPPIEVARSGRLEADIASLTAAIFRDMEQQIRSQPEHWIYLQGIGSMLGGRLAVGGPRPHDWLAALDAAAPQIQAALPGWNDAWRDIRSMQAPAAAQAHP